MLNVLVCLWWVAAFPLETTPRPLPALDPVFTEEGLALVPAAQPPGAVASWRITTRAWGYAGALEDVQPIPAQVTRAEARYDHGALREWYREDARGLEHGYDVAARPPSGSALGSPLEVRIAVEGAQRIELAGDRASAVFVGLDPRERLRYAGLSVLDADGRALPAWMDVDGRDLVIRVDDGGARYPLAIDPILSSESARLMPLDPKRYARHGTAVEVEGDLAIVGAYGDYAPLKQAGSAYVFRTSGSGWSQEAKLFGAGGYLDGFGFDVDLSGDRALVGAPWEGSSGHDTGAGYVFAFDGQAWNLEAKLSYSGTFDFANMGRSLALAGEVAALGAPLDFEGSTQTGRVFVFERVAGVWTETQRLAPSDGAQGDTFGYRVALDGDVLVVGSPYKNNPGVADGAAYVFERSAGRWIETARLSGGDGADGEFRYFGNSVAVDGNTVAVGCPGFHGVNVGSGMVFVFRREPSGWIAEERLEGSDSKLISEFGRCVDLDGDWLVAGSRGEAIPGLVTGTAYAFLRQPEGWREQTRLQHGDFDAGDGFGGSIAADGSECVVGAPSKGDEGPVAGAAYAFELVPQPSVGTPFCSGDGSGTACPCGNESSAGSGRGCVNSTGEGALLHALGSATVSEPRLGVYARELPPRTSCILLGSLSDLGSGIPFQDGLLCLGAPATRIGWRQSGATGVVSWDPDVAQAGPWGAGDTLNLQAWFRDAVSGPCGMGSNTTGALAVVLEP